MFSMRQLIMTIAGKTWAQNYTIKTSTVCSIEQASWLKAGKWGEIGLDKNTFPPSCPYSTAR
jgi:hypothetical protein